MNRKAFIQDKSAMFLLHPQIAAMGKSERLDAAINLAEALWERLKDRGYGPTTATPERSSHDWYSELQDQEEFDRCRKKFDDKGDRNKAAKAWSDFNRQLSGIEQALLFSENYELADWVRSLEDSWQEWRPTNA